MGADEPKGFEIRDRRGRGSEGEPAGTTGGPATTRASGPSPQQASETTPPVTFSSLVFSLGTSALMFMGEQLDPAQPRPPVNLAQAKEIIEILSMLEEKTKGNLTSEERGVLEDMLYALRMKYVSLASGKPQAGPA